MARSIDTMLFRKNQTDSATEKTKEATCIKMSSCLSSLNQRKMHKLRVLLKREKRESTLYVCVCEAMHLCNVVHISLVLLKFRLMLIERLSFVRCYSIVKCFKSQRPSSSRSRKALSIGNR